MSLQDKILKRKLKKKEKQKLKIIEDRKNNDTIEEDDDDTKTQEEFQIGSDVENHGGTKRKAEEILCPQPDRGFDNSFHRDCSHLGAYCVCRQIQE